MTNAVLLEDIAVPMVTHYLGGWLGQVGCLAMQGTLALLFLFAPSPVVDSSLRGVRSLLTLLVVAAVSAQCVCMAQHLWSG
jgi:hypothetical protein